MWAIAFGVAFGLAIFFWLFPIIGAILSSKTFWKIVGIVVGLIVVIAVIAAIAGNSSSKSVPQPIQTNNSAPINYVPNNTTNNQPSFFRPPQYQIWVTVFGGSTADKIIMSAFVSRSTYQPLNPATDYIYTSSNAANDTLDVYCHALYTASDATSTDNTEVSPAPVGADGTGGYRLVLKTVRENDVEFTCTDISN